MAVHLKAKVEPGGKIVVDGAPFPEVEVSEPEKKKFPLRGKTPYRFDDPFSPAAPPEDWDALR